MKFEIIMDRIVVGIFRVSALVLHVLALSPSIGALSCYECHSQTSCNSPERKQCDGDFDACVLQTKWRGDLYLDVTMSRYCGYSSECPHTSPDRTPFCNQTDDVLSCTMCCNDADYCNNGGKGKILRPPPYPPAPTPLVKKLAENVCTADEESHSCTTTMSWTEKSTVVNVVAVCGEFTSDVPYPLVNTDSSCENNNEQESGFCVTCCTDGKCQASRSTSLSSVPVLLLVCSLVRWLVTS